MKNNTDRESALRIARENHRPVSVWPGDSPHNIRVGDLPTVDLAYSDAKPPDITWQVKAGADLPSFSPGWRMGIIAEAIVDFEKFFTVGVWI